jgi:UDP-GlcNAc:undecaprenyl-phosphate GlcNAc-1-phosphate transferase
MFKSWTGWLVLAAFGLSAWFAGSHAPRPHYPHMVLEEADGSRVSLLLLSTRYRSECEAQLDKFAAGARGSSLGVTLRECKVLLTERDRKVLSGAALDLPVASMGNGFAVYEFAQVAQAVESCMETERIARRTGTAARCFPINTVREPVNAFGAGGKPVPWVGLAVLAAAIMSWLGAMLIVRYQKFHMHLSNDAVASGPQKFHAVPTPRIGGLGVLAGLLAGGGVLLLGETIPGAREFGLLLVAATPAFLCGLSEDITKNVPVSIRLTVTMLSGVLGCWLIGGMVGRLELPGLDQLFHWTLFAILFTAFAVGGLANAINIIDGYNGLACGYAVIVLAAISCIAAQVGDALVLHSCLILIGALLGFLAWNYPSGKIFLGDGGAYMLGFLLAELAIFLVVRNPGVSAWLAPVLLAYPIFETFFSIYRKRVLRGDSPARPDGLHLHMLIYKRLARVGIGSRNPQAVAYRNSRVAPYVWVGASLPIVPAVFFWDNTAALMAIVLAFCIAYVWLYRRLVQWRAPSWLLSSTRGSAGDELTESVK